MAHSELQENLLQLKNLYAEALSLEQTLQNLIHEGKLSYLPANTRKKKALMERIEQQFALVEPLLSGVKNDSAAADLQTEARELLQEIVKTEEENQSLMTEKQAAQVSEMKQNQSARRFARGYKPARDSLPASKLDKKG